MSKMENVPSLRECSISEGTDTRPSATQVNRITLVIRAHEDMKIEFWWTDVLVHSGCHSKEPSTVWLINNKNLFLMVLEAASPRSKCWQIRCPVRVHFLVHRQCLLTVSSPGKGVRELSGASSLRSLITFMTAPPS